MQEINERVSKKIARMGIACAMLVVFIHSYLAHAPNEPFNPVASFVQEMVSQGIARIAVPFFFVVSGIFLYRDFEFTFTWFRKKLVSRFWSLGVPYILWALIGLAFAIVTSMFARKVSFETFQWSSPMWWIRMLGVIEKPLYLGQLWFVHMLLEWLCLAPIVGALVKKFRFVVPAVCFVVMSIPSIANPWTNALMYISFGACVSQSGATLSNCVFAPCALQRLAVPLGVAWLGMLAFRACCVTAWGWTFPEQYILISIVVGIPAIWLGYDLLERRISMDWVDGIVGASFFVYCSHNIFLVLFRSPLRRLPIWDCDLIRYVLPPFLSIVSAILTWWLLGMWLPRFRRLLCGGR